MIATVTEADLPDLLPLMRGYCDFYEVSPPDDALLELSRTLISDPDHEGVQLIARDDDGQAVGFATVFWTWSTLSASRLGVMNDLFVAEGARGDDGRALGFATIFWTWSTLSAARLGVMNDLFVSEAVRGTGTADALIEACAERCRERGATELAWQTAHTNLRAQAVYERVGAKRDERWLDYSLSVEPGATTPDS